jgi:hypothetical protein
MPYLHSWREKFQQSILAGNIPLGLEIILLMNFRRAANLSQMKKDPLDQLQRRFLEKARELRLDFGQIAKSFQAEYQNLKKA